MLLCPAEGTTDDAILGSSLGLGDGMALLCIDGMREGLAVGPDVRKVVGETVGDSLGMVLVSAEGIVDDTILGAKLGLGEGMALLRNEGRLDGLPEGTGVGMNVGNELVRPLGSAEGTTDDKRLGT